MTELNPPGVLENAVSNHALGIRQFTTINHTGVWSAVTAGAGDLLVTNSGRTITIAAGGVYVRGTQTAAEGLYSCYNDGPVTRTLAPGGATNRQDLIIARVQDTFHGGSADNWSLEVIDGTSVAPATPTIPSNYNAYILAVATVTTASAVSLVDKRWPAVAGGGIVVRRSTDPLPTLMPGLAVFFSDTKVTQLWDGSAWTYLTNPRPSFSSQVNQPPFNTTATYVDFTNTDWPAASCVVPPSGQVWVTITAQIINTYTNTSTVWASYRLSGAGAPTGGGYGLSTQGGRVYGSDRRLWTGLTPGQTMTAVPQWNISSGNAASANFSGGRLYLEPVP